MTMALTDPFLWPAVLAGIALAVAAAPLGCFIVWRRMAYFGDATAHAAILGVALALALEMPLVPGVLIAALTMGLGVSLLSGSRYSTDTILGVMAHGALGLGLMSVSLFGDARLDLMSYLRGDILAVGYQDLWVIWIGAALVITLMCWRWRQLLLATLNPDLAWAAGENPRREQLILSLALAITVAVALKIIGALLIGAMLIIPVAAARGLARTPESMAIISAIFGVVCVLGGIELSVLLDAPTGPSIVTSALVLFAAMAVIRIGRGHLKG